MSLSLLIITGKSNIEDIVIIMKLRRSKVSYFLEFSAKLSAKLIQSSIDKMINIRLRRNAEPAGPMRALQLNYTTLYERVELNDNKSAEPNTNGDTHNGEHIEVELERVEHNDNNSAGPNTKGDILQDRVKRVHWAMDNITYGDQEKEEEIEGEEEEIGPPPPQFYEPVINLELNNTKYVRTRGP